MPQPTEITQFIFGQPLSRPYQFFTAIRSISIKKSRQPGDADQGERDMRWHRPEDAITLSMKAI
jgi:hypothetical protein